MATLPTKPEGLSPVQVGLILSEIAHTATQIRELAIEIVMGAEASAQFAGAIQSLAERAGWMADLVSADLAVGTVHMGAAAAWMLPPAFHQEGTHGV